jgi:protein SCO1/2
MSRDMRGGGMLGAQRVLALVVALMLSSAGASAQHAHSTQHGMAKDTPSDVVNVAAHRYFSDVPLVDQEGRQQRLYSDLMRGKTVVMTSFFTSCTATCPLVMSTFAALQAELGERLGRDVHLLLISVDPDTDTPARVKEYAERFGARPGWYLLTGASADVALALRKFGHPTAPKEAHLGQVAVGNDRTGLWKKMRSLPAAGELVVTVRSVLDDR